LIPSPKHIIIDFDESNELKTTLFKPQQEVGEMLTILGYENN